MRGDVTDAALAHPGISGFVEQCRYPQLEIQSRGDEQVRAAEQRHKARLGLHEMRILVAIGDRCDRAAVTDDLARNGGVGSERRDDLERLAGRLRAERSPQRCEYECNERA